MIIVDNVADNFQRQPENGIFIRSWFDDMTDTALSDLLPLLKGKAYEEISIRRVKDVREALRNFRDYMVRQIAKGDQNPKLLAN